MAATPFDAALYADLFGDAEIAALFTDAAEIRAMLQVEAALSRVQGDLGLIPAQSAAVLFEAGQHARIDPAALSASTGLNGIPVPGLVAAFRDAIPDPGHAAFAHWGATTQDIMDTGLMLRLQQVTTVLQARLATLTGALGALAALHATTPMVARTWGQAATPTSFGAVVASWGQPQIRNLARLDALKPRLLVVSLGGASGTLSVMEGKGALLRAGMAEALGLGDPGSVWHTARDGVAEFAGWMVLVAGSLGKLGEDLILLADAEVNLGAAGGSSTMPQKQNPVGPSVIVALARHLVALNGGVQSALLHRQQRDAAAWMLEWLALPQMCIGLGRALSIAGDLVRTIRPDTGAMRAAVEADLGLVHAEALTFALARAMPRAAAAAAVKDLCAEARRSGTPLPALAASRYPGTPLPDFAPEAQMGEAPAEALAFARAAAAIRS